MLRDIVDHPESQDTKKPGWGIAGLFCPQTTVFETL
jgi:hypothetical protein